MTESSLILPAGKADMGQYFSQLFRQASLALRKSIATRRHGMRVKARHRAFVSFTRTVSGGFGCESQFEGYTRDISRTGLSLVIASSSIDLSQFVNRDFALRIVLKIPTGTVNIQATPLRYEALNDSEYLICARIKKIDETGLAKYLIHLHSCGGRVNDVAL